MVRGYIDMLACFCLQYWVTHADVNSSRVIRLPGEAEIGGYKGIWKKTLHLMHYIANSEFGKQYDYVFKGDDDTHLNLYELRKVLNSFDPAVPAQFGNNLYGVPCRGSVFLCPVARWACLPVVLAKNQPRTKSRPTFVGLRVGLCVPLVFSLLLHSDLSRGRFLGPRPHRHTTTRTGGSTHATVEQGKQLVTSVIAT